MKTLKITSQREWNALPERFDEFTAVEIVGKRWIIIKRSPGNARVYARENSKVDAQGKAIVEARENAKVIAWGNAEVIAWGDSSVEAWENSKVYARGNAKVVARENADVVAYENVKVIAWGDADVVAYDNSKVVAWGDANVEALNNSIVEVWENSTVGKKDSTATVRYFKSDIPKDGSVENWLKSEFVPVNDGKVILYKRVSKDFKTQEGTPNETVWTIGKTLTVKNWNPGREECGPGKFHACSRPYFCDEFRDEDGDRYIAIEVAIKDLKAWRSPDCPHKIAFRKGKVLRKCGRMG